MIFTIFPLSFVPAPTSVIELALTIMFVFAPGSFISVAILKKVLTLALFHTLIPLAFVPALRSLELSARAVVLTLIPLAIIKIKLITREQSTLPMVQVI